MNITFTTYAEKKAKQFLNLLQGYTKGIRITAILILLLMGVSNAWATNGTISGGSIIYLNSGGSSIWDQASAWFSVYFMDANKSTTKFVSMTKVTGNYYYATVPTGTWKYVIFVRNNPTDKTADWTNVWNQTADLETQSDKNLYTITGWSYGSWSTYQPTATGSLVASSSNNVAKNTNITLTPSISPTTYNVLKSTSYSISPSSGATISNNTFKATAGGSYTVTATITYNAKGFTNITKTATPTTTITVKPTITFNANGGSGSMSAQTVSYNTNTTLSANTFTAPVGYTFNGWNTKTDGIGTAYAAGTSYKFTSDLTLYAQWAEIPANNHNITYNNGAGWTYGAQPASAAEGAIVTFEVIPTTGYIVTVTSSDVSLSNNGNTYTFTMPTKDVTINVSAIEKTHDVTISYKCGDQAIQANGTATAVGEVTPKEITAPEITGYKFTSWTLGNGITNKSANNTTNPINITTKASGTYTLTANYEEVVTVYFVNSSKWDAVACHHWPDGGSGTSWPGDVLSKTGETVNEFDVYKATFTSEHDMCIFNNNGGGQQTENLEVQDGKYYYLLKNQWYDSLNDIPAIDPLATNVFIAGGMNGWSTNTDEFRKATKEAPTASIILNLSANTDYEFKVIRDGAWTGYKGTITTDASGLQFSSSTNDNAKITTTVAGDYTFTWTISSSKLAVTYPTIYAITATANEAAMGTIEGAGNYGKGSTATLTATPNDGYQFVNWTKGGEVVATTQEYSFTVTEAVALVANFEAAQEEVHNVTVSYVCGGNQIADDQTVAAVGVTTAKTVEAPEIWGYTFSSWTLGAGVTSTNELTSSTIDINTKADGSDFTLTANYTEIPKVTVYFVNNKKWSKVYAYGWGGSVGENPAWPGQDITANKEAEQIVGFDVYSYSVVPGSYVNIKFTNNSGTESANFKWTNGKYYYMGADADYTGGTKDEVTSILEEEALATDIYLAGTMTEWGTKKIEFKRVAIDATTATVSAELAEDQTYEFKIIDANGIWLGNSGTMTRDDCTGWVFRQKKDDDTSDEDNGKIYADASGEYIFTWDLETKKLTVTYPAPTAKYIYFKNNPGWNKVYVYFFNNENFGNLGASSSGLTIANKRVAAMTRIENTDIWQYEYGTTGITPSNVIAFTEASQPNYSNFHNTKAVYRSDFNKKMELFIPQKTSNETKNGTKYYSKGVWMKYNATESGYSLDLTDEPNKPDFTTENVGGYVFSTTIRLNASKTYKFKIPNVKGDKFATSKSITFAKNNNDVEFTTDDKDDVNITTNTAGVYTFMIDLSSGKLKLSVDYPLADGDYRLAYKENDGTKNTKFHPAQYIRKVTEDTKLDIVSFYINKEGDNPAIVLQQASVDNVGNVKWNNVDSTLITLSTIESGVYNVALQQTNEGSHQATILCNDETYPQAYTGNYYIRTDAANGGWGFYEQETNQMEYTNLNADYDYYYCKWFNNPTGNVRFVVANDYSECVSDTMKTDDFLEGEQLLGESANVRYAWSSKTNTTSRAYLAGSGSNTEYLTINGTNIYSNAATPEQISGKRKFVDQNDWVYALDIKAKHGAVIDVKAVYTSKESTFIENKNIMSTKDGDANFYTLRVIYNFKTNNIVSSWLLQNVEQDMALSADIMMIRNGQDSPNQLKLINESKITGDPKTVYGVMQFDKSDITDNNKSIEERGLYWISFPFDVKLVDVFGLGEYGTAWIIQYYDGEERAQKGWFQETATFWKYVMPEDRKNFVLKANVGYGLALDIEAIDWPNDINQQNLYFPSAEKIDTIDSELTSTTVEVPAHTCIIERDDRKTKDSHWNVIGVPSYADAENVVSPDGLKFLYEWNAQNNTLSVSETTTHTFKAMHSYMVQFAGTIDWEHKNIAPAALAAKAPAKESTLLQLTLTEGDKQLDQTYVELTDEATAAFDMNMDLTKFFNTGHANIYSCIQTVPVAANMLPVQSVQVPLGIQVVKEGSYTIALPASVDAALVTLIDNQTQTHTCLNTSDYTVTLPAGTYENRFFLAVEPQRVVTSNPANKQDTEPTVKFIKDGQLYILHQGVIYDAQGRR